MDFTWITKEAVLELHTGTLRLSGGLFGICNDAILESALARPRNKFGYGETEICCLAAAYGFGIAKDHPFADGNKRMAFVVTFMFLDRNGYELEARPDEVVAVMLALSDSSITEEQFSAWLRDHILAH